MAKDKLAALGYRLRERIVKSDAGERPGEISFDDRGNAVYQWHSDQLAEDSAEAERLRQAALDHPGLAIVDEEPRPETAMRPNPKGLRLGYNPYQSGMLEKKEWKPKRNLRELSRWIETKRALDQKKDPESEE
jgi:hypothetical protein